MDVFNLLSTSQTFVPFTVEGISTKLNWLGNVIGWIFKLVSDIPGAIAVGVILFTLMLKTLVLPLDIYSRVKMRKQSLVMESMRPEMEKLQKQYANDKQMYNQKVMELQKANGYNPLGACLPTIVSLVIFMIVFSAFSQYSQYANLSSYNEMAKEYSTAVNAYVLTEDADEGSNQYFLTVAIKDGADSWTTDIMPHHINGSGVLVDENGKELDIYGYLVDYEKFAAYYESDEVGKKLPNGMDEKGNPDGSADWATMSDDEKNEAVREFVREDARKAAADYYMSHKPQNSLLWIGNVWYPDSMLNKEVPSFDRFSSAITRAAGSIPANYEVSYNEVTANLSKEKNTYNGYFVLIVLAIGSMFLQQFITMRSQKAANEFSSVDGQGARTNKMMMVMMPIIFGIFSFFYSAAFSIYMIVNTAYSLISTVVINKIVSVRFNKNIETKNRKKLQGRAGRKRLK